MSSVFPVCSGMHMPLPDSHIYVSLALSLCKAQLLTHVCSSVQSKRDWREKESRVVSDCQNQVWHFFHDSGWTQAGLLLCWISPSKGQNNLWQTRTNANFAHVTICMDLSIILVSLEINYHYVIHLVIRHFPLKPCRQNLQVHWGTCGGQSVTALLWDVL